MFVNVICCFFCYSSPYQLTLYIQCACVCCHLIFSPYLRYSSSSVVDFFTSLSSTILRTCPFHRNLWTFITFTISSPPAMSSTSRFLSQSFFQIFLTSFLGFSSGWSFRFWTSLLFCISSIWCSYYIFYFSRRLCVYNKLHVLLEFWGPCLNFFDFCCRLWHLDTKFSYF